MSEDAKTSVEVTPERAHAILSASSSSRWLICTPSARFVEHYPDKESVYMQEGSFAHKLAEATLREMYEPDAKTCDPMSMLDDPFWTPELDGYVEGYVAFVIERYNMTLAKDPSAVLLLEQRLDYSRWVPEGFGTGDALIIGDGILDVIDFKYGKGVEVSADGNTQMRLYAAGAWMTWKDLYDFALIRMTIYQPRKSNVEQSILNPNELINWMERYVQPRAELAWSGSGVFVCGEHCRFCPALGACRAHAQYQMELEKTRKPAGEMTPEETAGILARADLLTKWAGAVKEYALLQARDNGVQYPGWKLVEGRSDRMYADPDKVVAKLKAEGYAEAALYERKLLGITGMEALLGKKKFGTILKDLVIKPAGSPTLVPESDRRNAIQSNASARADFAEPTGGQDNG